eukprot:1024345-Alexandrium_andersonii.AAC.1
MGAPADAGAEDEGTGVGGGHQRGALSPATPGVACRPVTSDTVEAGRAPWTALPGLTPSDDAEGTGVGGSANIAKGSRQQGSSSAST